jgi:hypothetical protein
MEITLVKAAGPGARQTEPSRTGLLARVDDENTTRNPNGDVAGW